MNTQWSHCFPRSIPFSLAFIPDVSFYFPQEESIKPHNPVWKQWIRFNNIRQFFWSHRTTPAQRHRPCLSVRWTRRLWRKPCLPRLWRSSSSSPASPCTWCRLWKQRPVRLRNSGGRRLCPWETSAHSVTSQSPELQLPALHCVQRGTPFLHKCQALWSFLPL